MGIEMGRVSGPLLSENLLRNGENLAFDTTLLYFDVNSGYVGVNTDSPTRAITISGTSNIADILVTTRADIAALTVVSNKVQNVNGSITFRPDQTTNPTVSLQELQTANLSFTNQKIENLIADSDIDFAANGTGQVKFFAPTVNVNGTLHSTGDITWDGTITFGNDSTDGVTFKADITSNIIPDVDNTYDLGTSDRYWQKLYSVNLNATTITTPQITANNIDLLLTQGYTFYVSVNGNDTNYGNHLHSTYRTIKQALTVAQPGDEIVIFPGTYIEIFPLTVPQGVSVRGMDIRNVIVKPTAGTNTNNAFLLNGDTTVSFLTVRDFYSPGNGFSFANNFTVSTRSPYVQNVTVITAGPNAGNGALVDGSVANSSSNQASMLFHAVTMIVPDAIGIHATNGTRVEWLNSFTYFANKGIYLTDGTLGFASQGNTAAGYDTIVGFYGQTGILLTGPNAITVTVDVSSVGAITITSVSIGAVSGIYTSAGGTRWIINLGKFGAELRSINSANIYGTFGAVADGASTKGYLVGHNFSYIGAGIDTTNDATLVNQANEIVAINGGQLFYESIDQQGDFRIGDIFYINQRTGDVSFNAQSLNFNASGGLVFESQYGITSVTPHGVQTGNIRFEHNSIIGLLGPVNLFAKSSSTRLNTDVFVTGSIDITNDVNVKGNLYFGNETSDTVAITPNLTQTIKPNQTNTFTLGKKGVTPEVWNTAFLKLVNIDGITQLANNTISTLTTDTDLQLIAAGIGKIQVSTTDVQINDNLTVVGTTTIDGTSSLKNLEIVGTTTLTGDINQTGSTGITGLFANNNIIITGANSYFTVPNIKLQTNKISATFLNDDLTFAANGLGGVVLDSKLKFTDSTISNRWLSATTDLQKSVIFSPNGTGDTVVNTTRFLTIPYANNSDRVLAAFGEVRQNSTTTWYEGYLPTGNVSFNNLYDFDKNTYITAELTPGNNDKTLRFSIDGTVRATITSTALSTSMVNIDNVQLTDNTVSNTVASTDLEFFPSGTGNTNINGVLIQNSKIKNQLNTPLILSNTGTGYVKFNGTYGVVIPSGTDIQRPVTAEMGEIRYNTERAYIEVFDGTIWTVSSGSSGNISENDVTEIMNFWSIILG